MIQNFIAPDRVLTQYTWHEALVAAGSSDHDPVFRQDQCLEDWLSGQKYQIIEFDVKSYSAKVEQAVAQGMNIVIIKEKSK
jgi:hypothetical protein